MGFSSKSFDYTQSNTYNLWRLLKIGKTSQHVLLLDKEQHRFKMCGGMKWIVVRRAENLSGEPDRRLMREMREEGGTQRLLQNRLGPALRYKEETLYLELGTIGDNSIIRQYFYRSIWVANLLEIKRRSCASDSSI
jgi:hypothetical protein